MKRVKGTICGIAIAGAVGLNACGVYAAGNRGESYTAAETAECVMESLKELDLDRFNACTDNHVATYHNWIGLPVESEYRVFNELLQPGVKLGKRKEKYEFNRKLSEKMMENLAWEIEEVREEGNQAEIVMEITNLDMTKVMGEYELLLLDHVLESEGAGIWRMFGDLANIMDEEEGLLAIVEECDEKDVITLQVTATAFLEEGQWRLHLDDAFINAFMGNIDAGEYSEDMQRQVREMEKRTEEKIDEWADEFADKVERWAEGW